MPLGASHNYAFKNIVADHVETQDLQENYSTTLAAVRELVPPDHLQAQRLLPGLREIPGLPGLEIGVEVDHVRPLVAEAGDELGENLKG